MNNNKPTNEVPALINLPNTIVGISDDDFFNNRYSYKKEFKIAEYTYTFIWTPFSVRVELRISKGNSVRSVKFSKELIYNTYDLINFINVQKTRLDNIIRLAED